MAKKILIGVLVIIILGICALGVYEYIDYKEYKKAQEAISTIPCEVKCNNCGVCSNLKTKKILAKKL